MRGSSLDPPPSANHGGGGAAFARPILSRGRIGETTPPLSLHLHLRMQGPPVLDHWEGHRAAGMTTSAAPRFTASRAPPEGGWQRAIPIPPTLAGDSRLLRMSR